MSCAVGAIGGAASAIAAPLIRDQVYADSAVVNYSDDPVRQALTVGLATLIGGTTGLLLGGNSTSAALAAQNESLNNATSGTKKPAIPDDVRKMMEAERRAFGQVGSKPGSANSDVPPMIGPSPLVLGGANKDGAPGLMGPKVPSNLQPFTNPPQSPVVPPDWVSRPGRTPGSTIYYPPGTDPSAQGSTYIRVMPPGSTPVPGLENGYWLSIQKGQPINPATGGTGTRGDTHVPLPPNGMPPQR